MEIYDSIQNGHSLSPDWFLIADLIYPNQAQSNEPTQVLQTTT